MKTFIFAIVTCMITIALTLACDHLEDKFWDLDINEMDKIPDYRNINSYNYSNGNFDEQTCPTYTWYSVNLRRLDLSHNNFTTLPPTVENLTALQCLYLNDNKVAYLPDKITACTELRLLNLSNNPSLDALPLGIANLPITYLNLTGTGVAVLPVEMEERVKAGTLRIEGFTGKFIIIRSESLRELMNSKLLQL